MKLLEEIVQNLNEDRQKAEAVRRSLKGFEEIATTRHPGFVTQQEVEKSPWEDLDQDWEDPKVKNAVMSWIKQHKGKVLDFNLNVEPNGNLGAMINIFSAGGNGQSMAKDWIEKQLIPLIKKLNRDVTDVKIAKMDRGSLPQGEGADYFINSIWQVYFDLEIN